LATRAPRASGGDSCTHLYCTCPRRGGVPVSAPAHMTARRGAAAGALRIASRDLLEPPADCLLSISILRMLSLSISILRMPAL
jgi:hypothetical protein